MNMKRRDFSLALAAAGCTLVSGQPARAQGGPVEGKHYTRLQQPAAVQAADGKVEVVEFFWYGCPHCHALEPTLEAWAKQLPPDVVLRRSPVAFGAIHETHGRIYFALEALGQVGAMHRKVFNALHGQKLRLDKEADIVAFMAANGVDGPKFAEAFKSFTVQTRSRQSKQLADAYRIDSVPTLGVQGRFVTSASLAGSNEGALQVVDFLVQQVRKRA